MIFSKRIVFSNNFYPDFVEITCKIILTYAQDKHSFFLIVFSSRHATTSASITYFVSLQCLIYTRVSPGYIHKYYRLWWYKVSNNLKQWKYIVAMYLFSGQKGALSDLVNIFSQSLESMSWNDHHHHSLNEYIRLRIHWLSFHLRNLNMEAFVQCNWQIIWFIHGTIRSNMW